MRRQFFSRGKPARLRSNTIQTNIELLPSSEAGFLGILFLIRWVAFGVGLRKTTVPSYCSRPTLHVEDTTGMDVSSSETCVGSAYLDTVEEKLFLA